MIREIASAFAVFLLLCAAAGVGVYLRPLLPEHHREKQTTELMHLVITMQVTFAGLVLGLLISGAKTEFNTAYLDRQQYAFQLTALDDCLRDFGPATEPARAGLHNYTAAVIASTWPAERRPGGVTYPNMRGMKMTGESLVLTGVMTNLSRQLIALQATTPRQATLLPACRADFHDVTLGRWAVIEDAQGTASLPLYWIMVFWLGAIFLAFGLVAPRNLLALVGIFFAAVSLTLAIYVIDDLSQPYGGLFGIPSTEMRAALTHMLAP